MMPVKPGKMVTLPVRIGGQVAAPAKLIEWGITEHSCEIGQYCTILENCLHIEEVGRSVYVPSSPEPVNWIDIAASSKPPVDGGVIQYKRFTLIRAISLINLEIEDETRAVQHLNEGLKFNGSKVETVWLREV